MPRLPDYTAVGELGSYRSGRRWADANDVDSSAIGKGLRSFGGNLSAVGADMTKEAEAEGLMTAELHKAKYGAELERSFDTDPNYNTYSMRFKTGVAPINKDAAALIPNGKMRQKWLEKAQLDDINQHDALMKRANAMDREKKFVGVQSKLDELQNLYTETGDSNDDAKRLQNQKDIEAFIQTGELGGVIDPSQGKALRDKYVKGTQLNYAQTLLAKDPSKLIDQLSELDKQGYRPQDGLPDITITPSSIQRNVGKARSAPVKGFVIHETQGSDTFDGNASWSNKTNTGANYYIDKDGKIIEWAGDDVVMNHAGVGREKGARRDLTNANTLSVEIMTRKGEKPNEKQLAAARALVESKAGQYGFKAEDAVGHGEIAPGHKDEHEGMDLVNAIRSEGFKGKGTQVASADTGTMTDAAPSPQRTAAEQFLGRLSPEERATLMQHAKAKKTELNKAQFFSIKNDLDGVAKMVEKEGKMPADFDLAGKVNALVGMGKEAEANSFMQDMKKAQAAYAAGFTEVGGSRAPLSWSTEGELQDHLDKLAAKSKPGETGEDFAIRDHSYQKTEAKVKEIEKARKDDPAQLVEGDPEKGWDMHPAISAAQGQILKFKNSANDPNTIVLDERGANIMLAEARIAAQQDIGIPTEQISPITRKQEKELLNIPNPSMVNPANAMELFEDRLNVFKAQLGDEMGTMAFKSAVEHFVKDGDLKEVAGVVIPDLVSGKTPSFDVNRRMREAADLANFNRLMNGGTASGMQALPKRQAQPFLTPPTEYKGVMKRTPTDMEIEGLKKFPGRARIFDQMYGPGAAAAALSSQAQTSPQ